MFEVRPELSGTRDIVVTVDGKTETLKVPKFKAGNWAMIDNPEYAQ